MALIKCKECGNEVSNKAETCPKCGTRVARKPIGCGSAIFFIVLFLILISCYKYISRSLTSIAPLATSTAPTVTPKAPPVATNTDQQTYKSVRQGWLLDSDRRGEVALWQNPAPPFKDGNKIAAVVSFPMKGESMITDVTEERWVGGIIYYHIRFDESRQGWVDVDYLHWKKVRR
jgi:hypothetical protein